MLCAENKGMALSSIHNHEKLNHKHKCEIMTAEKGRKRFDGVFRDENWEGHYSYVLQS